MTSNKAKTENFDDALPDVIKKVIELAKGGNLTACSMVLKHGVSVPKPIEKGIDFRLAQEASYIDKIKVIERLFLKGDIDNKTSEGLLKTLEEIKYKLEINDFTQFI